MNTINSSRQLKKKDYFAFEMTLSTHARKARNEQDTDIEKLVGTDPKIFSFIKLLKPYDTILAKHDIVFTPRKDLEAIRLCDLPVSNFISSLDMVDQARQFSDSGILQFVKFIAVTYMLKGEFTADQCHHISNLLLATAGIEAADNFYEEYDTLSKNPCYASKFFNKLRHTISCGKYNLRVGDKYVNESGAVDWFDPRLNHDGSMHITARTILLAARGVKDAFEMGDLADAYLTPTMLNDEFLSSDRHFYHYVDKMLESHRQ